MGENQKIKPKSEKRKGEKRKVKKQSVFSTNTAIAECCL